MRPWPGILPVELNTAEKMAPQSMIPMAAQQQQRTKPMPRMPRGQEEAARETPRSIPEPAAFSCFLATFSSYPGRNW